MPRNSRNFKTTVHKEHLTVHKEHLTVHKEHLNAKE